MLGRTKESQMDKATNMMRDVAKYAQGVAQDKRLRADFRAALDHGSKASDRLKKDIQAGSIYTRLAADKKLRRNLRAMLDDLDDAGSRMRRGRSHRIRNAILVSPARWRRRLRFREFARGSRSKRRTSSGQASAEPDPLT